MPCKYQRIRSKHYERYTVCAITRQINPNCTQCKDKQYKYVAPMKKSDKPIKKRTYKQAKAERERYSIITNDLEHCIECGKTPINKHEIFYGSGKRQLSIKYGLVIPLCTCEHHVANIQGIHKDKALCDKWHKIGQLAFMKHYDKTEDEFIQIFGKSYLKGDE